MLWIAVALTLLMTLLEAALVPLLVTTPWRWPTLAAFNLSLLASLVYLTLNSRARRAGGSGPELDLVHDTLPVLRQGLNAQTAATAAAIIGKTAQVQGALILGPDGVLGVSGPSLSKQAQLIQSVQAEAATVMAEGAAQVVRLEAAVGGRGPAHVAMAPIRSGRLVVGAVALVGVGNDPPPPSVLRSASVFADLMGMQVDLGQLERQKQMVVEAELRALRAQINPHFLLNALNTVAAYSRSDPGTTRQLLVRLADMFKGTMRTPGQFVAFHDEFQHLKNYLFIEQARFQDKLHVVYDIEPAVLPLQVPALCLQPLVENAVRHGITPKKGPGTVTITARLDWMLMRVEFVVRDDGVGMPAEKVAALLGPGGVAPSDDRGVGLRNVSERLQRLFGARYALRIQSHPGRGTTVTLQIPMR